MALVGPYDASTFVEGNYATYPPLPAGAPLYEPTMHWLVTVAGNVQGQWAVPGDLLFATQGSGRLFGASTYGDQIFGGLSDGGWSVEQLFFLRWDSTAPPPDKVPYPNAGCPFAEWAPGWRMVVDAFYDNHAGQRTYGTDDFGEDLFGDVVSVASGPQWVDITRPSFHIEAGDGTTDGSQQVPVAEVVVDMLDMTGDYFDVAIPATWYQPQPGTAFRVGLIDPAYAYHPVVVGEIERIEDLHDGDHPRVVSIRGFGRIMDLTVDVAAVQRPAENASARFAALVGLAGWVWDDGAVTFPPGDAALLADLSPHDIVVRDEIDRTAQAVGWMFDSDRTGRMRLRTWPHEPAGTPLVVVDCREDDDPEEVRVSHAIAYANDESKLLNVVATTNTAASPVSVRVTDAASVSRFGSRGRALDYPKTGLAWSSSTVASAWAQRVLNRYAYITRQVESFEVDTALDPGWLAELADLDTGRAVTIDRRGVAPVTFEGVVVGWRHVIEPGRWASSIYTSTLTTSM